MWIILDKVGYFFIKLFKATKFAVVDYDSKLKVNKSPRQRFFIWISVVGLAILFTIVLFIVLRDVVITFLIPKK